MAFNLYFTREVDMGFCQHSLEQINGGNELLHGFHISFLDTGIRLANGIGLEFHKVEIGQIEDCTIGNTSFPVIYQLMVNGKHHGFLT